MACGSLQAFLLAAALASYSPQLPAWAAIGSEHAFRPRRWQVALAHVDGQRAVEHREDDAEPLARRHAYADADAPSGLRAVTLADLSLDFDRAGNAIHYAREFQQCPVVDNGHTSVESPLLRDEPLRAARSALQLLSLNRWIFPVAVRGKSERISIQRGYFHGPAQAFTCTRSVSISRASMA